MASEFGHKNFLQSPEFAKWRELCGDEVVKVAGNYMVIKNAKRGRYAEIAGAVIASSPKTGPEDTKGDSSEESVLAGFTSEIKQTAKHAGCAYVRVRPQLLASPEAAALFSKNGFKPAPRHLYAENTVILDLKKSEEQLLAEMRKQTRYEIKHLDRYPDLQIAQIKSSSPAAFAIWEDFADLQAELAARQGFTPPSRTDLQNLREAFGDKALLYIAKNKGQILAYALVITSNGEADYFEAASAEAAREIPVAYALQWQIIRDLKSAGVHCYNLFGIAPEGVKNHRYAKLTTFKRGFGGEVVNYLPAQDLPIQKTKYFWLHLYELLEKWRKKW
ncbi:MAG: aminoacyltransferase [Candidatus Nomurabacteria bacterium]|nr:aminoacyltransferase [Candidatus Nomurabacteria bacterium]